MPVEAAFREFRETGYAVLKNVYPPQLMSEVKVDFYQHEAAFIEIQKKKRVYAEVIDATHHTPVLCRKMLQLLEPSQLSEFLELFFAGEKYILNTMGLSKIRHCGRVYTQNIHRDVRSFHGATELWINTLVMLDDSTTENGATWIMPGSEKRPHKPSEDEFWESAVQVGGVAGDVLVFHGGVWHCAGQNTTEKSRHIITPFFSRPFIKQQLDYPRAFGPDFGLSCSDHLRQVLGYNAQTPSSLEDFYQPEADRFYQRDQG